MRNILIEFQSESIREVLTKVIEFILEKRQKCLDELEEIEE